MPCEDLDGQPVRLVVVALGGRVALAGPDNTVMVLPERAAGALNWLETIVVTTVHGGNEDMGETTASVRAEVHTLYDDNATLSITACPYDEHATIDISTVQAHITVEITLDAVRAVRQMCADTELVMMGWHQPKPNNTTDGR